LRLAAADKAFDHYGLSPQRTSDTRFTLIFTDPSTGETRPRASMQVYRVEEGKLTETWLLLQKLSSASPDAGGQERWTSSVHNHICDELRGCSTAESRDNKGL
jgi:hypothetical protein